MKNDNKLIFFGIDKARAFIIIKFFFVLFFGVIGFFCSNDSTNNGDTSIIEVSTNISEDTVWEKGKEYIVIGRVTVEEGVHLTINDGVNVIFRKDANDIYGLLRVFGRITCVGLGNDSRIAFGVDDGSIDGNNSGVYLENENLISIFRYCDFSECRYGINGFESSALIENCRFENCINGISMNKSDSCSISNCIFRENENDVYIEVSWGGSNNSIWIQENNFSNTRGNAIEFSLNSYGHIWSNTFENCNYGVALRNNSYCDIRYNDFSGCDVGCYFYWKSDAEIEYNRFNNNQTHIHMTYSSTPTFRNNNLLNYSRAAVELILYNDALIVDGKNNWWNTIIVEEIEESILHNGDDNIKRGRLEYSPFQESPVELL